MKVTDEIVISGISGRFPNSINVKELSHNLYNKIDMVDDAETRWKHFHPEAPKRMGKIPNLDKFDASFFATLGKHANWTDPQMRIILEHAYEAIIDAGVPPQSLVGTKTGKCKIKIDKKKNQFSHAFELQKLEFSKTF